MSLAKRVSYETLNEYGTEIAYQVRFEGSKTPATKVLFLTEGTYLITIILPKAWTGQNYTFLYLVLF